MTENNTNLAEAAKLSFLICEIVSLTACSPIGPSPRVPSSHWPDNLSITAVCLVCGSFLYRGCAGECDNLCGVLSWTG